jgi:hypothetical protein
MLAGPVRLVVNASAPLDGERSIDGAGVSESISAVRVAGLLGGAVFQPVGGASVLAAAWPNAGGAL